MKLFYAPGACSIGIHILLEELGVPYATQRVDLRGGEQRTPEYTARNPKGKVPTLERDDGTTLTEYGAISHYLARDTPLAPSGREAEARAIEALDYIVGSIHMQGFARLFRPANFTPNASDEDWVKTRGRALISDGFQVIDTTLGGQEYLFGGFGHVDCALFYVEFWAGRAGLALPASLGAHVARMKARPAVARVLADEGVG